MIFGPERDPRAAARTSRSLSAFATRRVEWQRIYTSSKRRRLVDILRVLVPDSSELDAKKLDIRYVLQYRHEEVGPFAPHCWFPALFWPRIIRTMGGDRRDNCCEWHLDVEVVVDQLLLAENRPAAWKRRGRSSMHVCRSESVYLSIHHQALSCTQNGVYLLHQDLLTLTDTLKSAHY